MLRMTLLHQEMLMMWMEKAVLLVAVSQAGCAASLDRKTCGLSLLSSDALACKPSYSGRSSRRLGSSILIAGFTQCVARLPHSNEMFTRVVLCCVCVAIRSPLSWRETSDSASLQRQGR